MSNVISSFSTKGGVGKTSFTKYYGITKVDEGKKVLIIDMCQNGDVASRLGYDRDSFTYYTQDWIMDECLFQDVVQFDEETGIYFIPSNHKVEKIIEFANKELLGKEFILKNKIDSIKDNFDLVMIDNHPSETNLMMILALVSSDYVVIPTLIDSSSVEATLRSAEIIEQLNQKGMNIEYFVQPMSVDHKMKKSFEEVVKYLEENGVKNILPKVRYSTTVLSSGVKGEEFSKKTGDYAPKVMKDYKDVSKELALKGVN